MDKVSLVVLMFAIAIGLIGYNQYLKNHGGISPVSKIIDIGGLLKKDSGHKEIVKNNKDYYHFEYKHRLVKLMEKRKEVEKQRLRLVKNRIEILGKLSSIDDKVIAGAKEIKNLLDKDKTKFLKEFPQLERICMLIKKLYKQENSISRQDAYVKLKKELWLLFDEIEKNPQDNTKLSLVIDEMDNIINSKTKREIKGCANIEKCLNEDIECLKNEFMNRINILVENPSKDLDEIIKLTNRLRFENRLITNNSEGTEDIFWQGTQRLDSEFDNLVGQLIKITDENMLLLIDFNDEFRKEQMMFLENLNQNKKRYFNYHKQVAKQINIITNGWKKGTFIISLTSFIKQYKELHKIRVKELEQYYNNEQDIRAGIIDDAQDREDFIYDIAESKNIDLDALLAKRKQQEEEQKVRSANAKMQWQRVKDRNIEMKNIDANPDSKSELNKVRTRKDTIREQKIRQQDIKQKMQNARDAVKDAGFYK